ncbi:HAD family hydrolase [Janibacter sp. G56]|uniref:HAD family hydrolase n=1 Tax=Janibacter sp. G56 TaxID=3418717 RepID=UPI003D047E25
MDISGLTDRTFDAVIFDNDGTLTDSTDAVVRSWMTWADEHGVPRERLAGMHGIPAEGIIARVAPHLEGGPALERITQLEVEDSDGIAALPGAVAAIEALPGRCAIATSATAELAHMRLAAAGLPEPTVLVTFDDVEHGKPAPDPFLLAAQRLGVDPTRCLVVEDAPLGVAGARAAGCAVLGLTTTTPADELDADAIVETLADVRFVVDGDVIRVTSAEA